MKHLDPARGLLPWLILVAFLFCVATISQASTRTVLTRWSPTGGVTVLDDGEVTSNFGIEPVSPQGVAVTADGSTLYAVEFSSGTLAKIDLEGELILEIIDTGAGALRVVLNASETLAYVTNRDDETVSVVDTSTMLVLSTISAPPYPRSVVLSPDEQTLYVTHNGIGEPDRVSKYTDLGVLVDSIEFDQSWPGEMVLSPDQSELLVALEAGSSEGQQGRIARIDLATFTLMENTPIDYRPSVIMFHPTGYPLYVVSWFDWALVALDPQTFEVQSVVDTVIYPAGADITPDGKHIYMLHGAGSSAFVVDTATNAVVEEIDIGGNARGFGNFIVGEPDPPIDTPATSGPVPLILLVVVLGSLTWLMRRRSTSP